MKVTSLTVIGVIGLVAGWPALYAQKEILKESGSEWEFLLAKDAQGDPVDPATLDGDFATTWHREAGYDGPAFLTGSGYFGYDTIEGATIATNLWNPDGTLEDNRPPNFQRYTVYFRTTFTPTLDVTCIRFTGIIDDGVIVYLDGGELTRINMLPGADTWQLLSDGSGDEDTPVSVTEMVSLPAGDPVNLSVSLHNASATSTDLGFDLLVESVGQLLPVNDNFADAIELTGDLPFTTAARTDDAQGAAGATKEPGEPDHAGNSGGASVWWSWTPEVSGRYYVSLDGSDFSTLLAVYTGTAVNDLTLLSRYPNLEVPTSSKSEPFYRDTRVEFDAVAGTTYRIAVDGAGGQFGTVALRLGTATLRLDPVAELLPAGSEWEYLLLVDENNQPIDPETVDEDFDSTWHTEASYDGPVFAGPAPALLGYGTISGDPLVTDIWGGLDHDGDLLPDDEPPSGLRFTTYYRTRFTPSVAVPHLGFEGLIDDGAVIYVNGVETTRLNIHGAKDADDWTTRANTNSAEDAPQVGFALDQNLPAGQEVEIALSLHNASSGSSDLGFDLRMYSVVRPTFTIPPNDNFEDAIVLNGDPPFAETGSTEDPVYGLGATKEPGEPNHAGRTGGGSIWWRWVPTTSGRVAISLAGSDFDTLLAVYTGTSVDALDPVSRYPSLMVPASSDEEPFHDGSRVEFDAVAGTTYHIAVDGDRAEFGAVMLAIDSVAPTPLDPIAELLPARSSWRYLLLVDESNQPIDPEDLDADFDATWHTVDSYDGPAFAGPAQGLFGYGNINAGEIVTDLWGGLDHDGDSIPDDLPPAELRFTTYFRTTFEPEEPVTHLAFEGLIDDGAVVYLDGQEVARLNVGAADDAGDWKTRALGNDNNGVNNENAPQLAFALDRNLPAGQLVELAVSLHNVSSSSSDMGFDLRVYSVNRPPPPPTSTLIVSGTAQEGQFEIRWESAPNGVYDLEFSETLRPDSWIPVASGIQADPSGVNSILHTPSVPRGFYRVRQTP